MNNLKYEIRNNQIFNRKTGVAIPGHEPVFIIRAKDAASNGALNAYIEEAEELGATDEFVSEIAEIFKAFDKWQAENPTNVPD